jgi:hypothetical protein
MSLCSSVCLARLFRANALGNLLRKICPPKTSVDIRSARQAFGMPANHSSPRAVSNDYRIDPDGSVNPSHISTIDDQSLVRETLVWDGGAYRKRVHHDPSAPIVTRIERIDLIDRRHLDPKNWHRELDKMRVWIQGPIRDDGRMDIWEVGLAYEEITGRSIDENDRRAKAGKYGRPPKVHSLVREVIRNPSPHDIRFILEGAPRFIKLLPPRVEMLEMRENSPDDTVDNRIN